MKSDDRSNSPKVRIAVLGNMDVGKSGKLLLIIIVINASWFECKVFYLFILPFNLSTIQTSYHSYIE